MRLMPGVWKGKKNLRFLGIKRKIAILLAFILSGSCVGCQKNDVMPKLLTPVSAEKEYVTVERGRVGSRSYYDAYVTPEIETVWFNYDGVVKECLKVCGDRVEEGDVLARLITNELDLEIEACTRELAYLQADHDYEMELSQKQIRMDQVAISMNYEEVAKLDGKINGVRTMLEKSEEELAVGTVSENDAADREDYEKKLEDYEMQRNHALEQISDSMHDMGRNSAKGEADTGIYQIDLEERSEDLERLKDRRESAAIISPCSGRILGAVSSTGEQLNSGDEIRGLETVYYIADESRAYFTVEGLFDREFKNNVKAYVIMNGKEYPVIRAGYNDRLKNEEEDFIKETWGQEQGLPLRFQTENPELMKGLEFGDFYQIVIVEKQAEDVLYVPNNAIYWEGNLSYVIRIEGKEEIKTFVETGLATVCYTEIKEGVEEGTRLVTKNVYFDTGDLLETELVSGNYIAEESFSRMSTVSYRNERISCPAAARLKELKVKNGDMVTTGDGVAFLKLYSNLSKITELSYRLTVIDEDYNDVEASLNKQKTILTGHIYELEAQMDSSGQIGMLQMQIDYLDTLLAQTNHRREYEKELVKDAIKRLDNEAALSNIKAGCAGRITDIAGITEGQRLAYGDTICVIRDERVRLLRIEDNEKLKYNMKAEIKGSLNGEAVTLTGRVIAADNVLPPWVYDREAYNKCAVVKPDGTESLEGFEADEALVRYIMYENAYVVNSGMVFTDHYGSYVYVIRDEKRVRRYVSITGFKNSRACILDGLWTDERVLLRKGE